MKRLQRKCLVASAAMHGLLVLVLLVGSAFISRRPILEVPPIELTEIPRILVDEDNVIGGGNPQGGAPQLRPIAEPQPAPRQPAPETKPEPITPEPPKEVLPKEVPKVRAEEPVKVPEVKPEPIKMKQPDPNAFDFTKTKKITTDAKPTEKPAPSIDLSKVEHRTIKPPKDAKTSPDGEEGGRGERDRQVASAKAGAVSDALRRMQGGLSSVGGNYEVPGPGGNSLSYIFALRKRYQDAWVGAATSGRNGVLVEVEIAKDGTVLRRRIVRKSGNAGYDRAAQDTINRVSKVDPLPSGVKESSKIYTFEIVPNETDRG